MGYRKAILGYASNNNGMITTQECRKQGIPTIYLTRLVDEGILNRVERGVYLSDGGVFDEYYVLQLRYKKIVYSYQTSLFLHELVDLIPKKITVSVPYSYKINVVPDNVNIRYVKEDVMNLGIVEIDTNIGNRVKTYDMERTIVDIITNQDFIDRETYITAIRNYMNRPDKDINKLFEYSIEMNAVDKVRSVIEVLYE